MAPLVCIFLLLNLNIYCSKCWSNAHNDIPSTCDGFVYGNKRSKFNPDAIMIEAFLDPVCPESRDSWPLLKQAIQFYGPRVSLIVHTFPLPYHDNSFVTSRALHIVNELNSSATFPLLEEFFKEQEKYYAINTEDKTKRAIVKEVINTVVRVIGKKYYSKVKSAFDDRGTDLKTRAAFKNGASRRVSGTPTFFINGCMNKNAIDITDINGWRRILDPLFSSSKKRNGWRHFCAGEQEDNLH
ncbi:hypothetical protein Drorol1_Dr00011529 [Drosera rotundifolia]